MKQCSPKFRQILSAGRTTAHRVYLRFNFNSIAFRGALSSLLLLGAFGVAQSQQSPDPLTITKEGNVGIGTADPGTSKLRIANPSGDYAHFRFDAAGGGELEFVGWPNGWNINSKTAGKNLYLNRDTSSDVLIGASSKELTVKGNTGNVGIGTNTPAAKLDIKDRVALQDADGRNYFKDFERFDGKGLRVGALWGQYGVFAETGSGALGGADGVTLQNGAVVINGAGNVGIGTSNPTRAKVEVIGSVRSTFSGGYLTSFNVPTDVYNPTVRNGTVQVPVGLITNDNGPISLYADNVIVAAAFWAVSDARNKRVERISAAARDLSTLMRIEVTDYSYVDSLAQGHVTQKKVIGQQVEKVFPQAVSKATDVVPDIYQKAAIKDGWVMLATNVKRGERVRLIGEKQEGVHEVLEVEEGRFRTPFSPDGDKVFVYGREVSDARRVDYEAISMLNVSATQELARRLAKLEERGDVTAKPDQKNAEVKALQEQNAALRTRVAEQEKRLAAIESLLLSAEKPAVRTASLKKLN